jgi:hypothetical protein
MTNLDFRAHFNRAVGEYHANKFESCIDTPTKIVYKILDYFTANQVKYNALNINSALNIDDSFIPLYYKELDLPIIYRKAFKDLGQEKTFVNFLTKLKSSQLDYQSIYYIVEFFNGVVNSITKNEATAFYIFCNTIKYESIDSLDESVHYFDAKIDFKKEKISVVASGKALNDLQKQLIDYCFKKYSRVKILIRYV